MLKNIFNHFLLIIVLYPILHYGNSIYGQSTLDQVIAIVQNKPILKSDIDERLVQYLANVRGQESFSKELWYTILKNTIDNYVILEKARIDDMLATTEQVNNALEQRIQDFIAQLGSIEAVERQFGLPILELKEKYRQQFKEDLTIQRYKENLLQDVNITYSEVENFYNEIPEDSLPTIDEQVALSQIVIIPPIKQSSMERAYDLAVSIRDTLIKNGALFEEMAIRHSQDYASSVNGGLLPDISITDVVPEYAAAASALQPGGISEVVLTEFGYHIIRLNKRIGDKISTNHILIKINLEELDDQYAIDKLNAIRDSIIDHGASFSEMAVEYSEEKVTAQTNGRLLNSQTGNYLIPTTQLEPSLYRIAIVLKEHEISEPKVYRIEENNTNKTAYRIVRIDKRIKNHVASLEYDYKYFETFAKQKKQFETFNNWLKETYKEVLVDYKINIPQEYKTQLQ